MTSLQGLTVIIGLSMGPQVLVDGASRVQVHVLRREVVCVLQAIGRFSDVSSPEASLGSDGRVRADFSLVVGPEILSQQILNKCNGDRANWEKYILKRRNKKYIKR